MIDNPPPLAFHNKHRAIRQMKHTNGLIVLTTLIYQKI